MDGRTIGARCAWAWGLLAASASASVSGSGCAGASHTGGPSPSGSAPTPTASWAPPGSGVITLTTSDGVALEADYYPSETAGAPGVVLLHMIPPSNDRTNWPTSFVHHLNTEGYAVLVVDRRGAGGSDGVAKDAYEGPNGKLDVAACAEKLAADGFGPLAVIGASNGTTSMLDYAVWAGGAGLPEPVALGFMTGGTYTEAQNPMSAAPAVPAVFTYSTAERAWSEAQRAVDPGGWVFHEYPNGAHGTQMFDAAPEVEDDLVAFLAGALGR